MATSTTEKWTGHLARGASVYFAGLVLGKGLLLCVHVLLGRSLGPARYGLYALGYIVITLVQWIASLGLDQGVLRFCSLYRSQGAPERVKGAIRGAILIAFSAAVVVVIALLGVSRVLAATFFAKLDFRPVLVIFALALPFMGLRRITSTFVQAHRDLYRTTVLQNVVQPFCNLLFLSVGLGYGLRGTLWAFVLSEVVGAGLGLYYLRLLYPRFWSEQRQGVDWSPMLRYSCSLMVVGLAYQFILRISTLLLGRLAGAGEVGLYSAGAMLAVGFAFVPFVFAQPSLPLMVEFCDQGRHAELRQLYRTVTRWALAAVVPGFLVLCLFRDEWLRLFGRGYQGGGTILALLCLGWLLYFCAGPVDALLEMTGRQGIELLNITGAGVVMVAANYWLIPRYGARGAAVATAAGLATWAIADVVEARVLFGIFPWSRAVLRQLAVAVFCALMGVLLRPHLPALPAGILVMALYAALYFGFCLEDEDRVFLVDACTNMRRSWNKPRPTPRLRSSRSVIAGRSVTAPTPSEEAPH